MGTSIRTKPERQKWDRKQKDAKDSASWSREMKNFTTVDDPAFFEPVDGLGLPERTVDLTPRQEQKLFEDFVQELATRGIELSYAGQLRLASWLTVAKSRGKQMSREAFEKSFNRLFELGCFGKEVAVDPAKATKKTEPVPEKDLSLDDLERLNLTLSREDDKRARQIVEGHYFGVEAREIWGQWLDSLSQNFDYVPPEAVKKQAFSLFQKRNL
jgi:hypothetical protein